MVLPYLNELERRPDDATLVQSTINTIRGFLKAFLTDYFLYLSRMTSPHEECKEKKDEIDALWERLKHAIKDKSTDKVNEAEALKASLAS